MLEDLSSSPALHSPLSWLRLLLLSSDWINKQECPQNKMKIIMTTSQEQELNQKVTSSQTEQNYQDSTEPVWSAESGMFLYAKIFHVQLSKIFSVGWVVCRNSSCQEQERLFLSSSLFSESSWSESCLDFSSVSTVSLVNTHFRCCLSDL